MLTSVPDKSPDGGFGHKVKSAYHWNQRVSLAIERLVVQTNAVTSHAKS
jgi:hypothetical protein